MVLHDTPSRHRAAGVKAQLPVCSSLCTRSARISGKRCVTPGANSVAFWSPRLPPCVAFTVLRHCGMSSGRSCRFIVLSLPRASHAMLRRLFEVQPRSVVVPAFRARCPFIYHIGLVSACRAALAVFQSLFRRCGSCASCGTSGSKDCCSERLYLVSVECALSCLRWRTGSVSGLPNFPAVPSATHL
jgi:hypothetical protein